MIGLGEIVYYARVNKATQTYEVCELKVRTVYQDSFVGCDNTTKMAFILSNDEFGETVFRDRNEAVRVVKEKQHENDSEEK